MARKIYDGVLKNKERTKLKLIDAVGQIIREEGYAGLKLQKIVDTAGVDRKLLYDYFGTIDNLVETYVRQKDYYMAFADTAEKLVKDHAGSDGRIMVQKILLDQLDVFSVDQDLQQILIWRLSEDNPILSDINEQREKIGSIFFNFLDNHFEGTSVDIRARLALIVAGIYFLVLYEKKTQDLFCEIDLHTPDGMERIRKAISSMTEEAFEIAERQKNE